MLNRLVRMLIWSLIAVFSATGLQASDFLTSATPDFSAFSHQDTVMQREPIQLSLIPEEKSIQSGRAFWLALRVKMDKEWHTYWKNAGDSGLATSVEWALPPGFKVLSLEWPTPHRFTEKGLVTFGYDHSYALLAKVMPNDAITAGQELEVEATIRWVACNDGNCIPGDCAAKTTLLVSKATPLRDGQYAALFTQARQALPLNTWNIQGKDTSGIVQLSLKPPGALDKNITSAFFLPSQPNTVDYQSELKAHLSGDGGYRVDLSKASGGEASLDKLDGVLLLQAGSKQNIAVAVRVTLKDKTVAMASTSDSVTAGANMHEFEGGMALALLMAFVGGMILNLMPCVLPVISLKVLSIVKMAGHSRLSTVKHGLMFTAGVLVSFWILAGVLLILQAYGHAVGWGFQLQEPIFVAILAAVLLVFALSLFGVFEIGLGVASWAGERESHNAKHSIGLSSSFFNGILATAVATPCTGPFLGAAIGFAVTLPPPSALLIFTFLGLGMAFPYFMLTLFPTLVKWLPKPGPWMLTFKQFMGFLLFATILWLLWVFGAQTALLGVFLLLCALFVLAVTCWVYGHLCHPFRPQITRKAGILLSIILGLVGTYILVISAQVVPEELDGAQLGQLADIEQHPKAWRSFSPAMLEQLRAEGKPVFIDFTAKWCVICQANHLVLSLNDIEQKFEDLGVVKIKADWTRPNPAITQELRRYGRNGVPLYLLYIPGQETPLILPQVLTPDVVSKYLDKLQTTVVKESISGQHTAAVNR